MAEKIMTLTAAQKARLPEFARKWIEIGLSTQPADREKAERAIKGLYRLAKLKEPRVIWLPCPISAALSAMLYARLVSSKRLGIEVGSAVRSAVDSAVYSAVGSAVYSAVGSAVRSAVDSAVGSAVRSAVDSAVRSAVDSGVDSAGLSFFGGSLWANYSAWADYFNEVLAISIDRNYLDLTESCGFYWTLDDVCFASERPARLNLDAAGRLHCENGQSIGYPSGWGLWHWHGVGVPRDVIEQAEILTKDRILKEANAEVRRVMIERLGNEKFLKLAGAKSIHQDRCGNLYRIELPGDEPLVAVEVVNSTPEPDGHFKRYFLRVPPNITRAKDAVAWTFAMKPEDYLPMIET